MIVQIYTMQTAEEAVALADIGVDRLGVTPADRGLPGEIGIDTAAGIVAAVRGRATTSAITVDTDLDPIVTMVERVRPDVLHLSGPTDGVSVADVLVLRDRFPSIEIMQAVAVEDVSAVDTAIRFAEVADSILLDSVTSDVEGIGAAGVVHDWSISRRIVEAVSVPVILAGGLSPENVTSAITAVRPWGVDSLTHTNEPLPGGGFRKSVDLVERFLDAARSVG